MLRLDLVVGPNGAGKSTFIAYTLAPLLRESVLVNADEIAGRRWPEAPELHSYEAAKVAEQTRRGLIEARRPFIAETVFSHPSKLELIARAREAGYIVSLHVLLVPEDLAVHRVTTRVAAGGHAVPEDKIRARYRRLWTLVATALRSADAATAYDNTGRHGPRIVAKFNHWIPAGPTSWPDWTPEDLLHRWRQ